jgi:hypothetical protein
MTGYLFLDPKKEIPTLLNPEFAERFELNDDL